MSFTDTLLNGHERSFKVDTLTPMQKLTLKYVVFGLVYYGFAAIEGMLSGNFPAGKECWGLCAAVL